MNTIHKYQLHITDEQSITMPVGAEILTVQNQQETLCIWAIVDDEKQEKELRHFVIRGTGHKLYETINPHKYLGSVQFRGGELVWHVFEKDALPF